MSPSGRGGVSAMCRAILCGSICPVCIMVRVEVGWECAFGVFFKTSRRKRFVPLVCSQLVFVCLGITGILVADFRQAGTVAWDSERLKMVTSASWWAQSLSSLSWNPVWPGSFPDICSAEDLPYFLCLYWFVVAGGAVATFSDPFVSKRAKKRLSSSANKALLSVGGSLLLLWVGSLSVKC